MFGSSVSTSKDGTAGNSDTSTAETSSSSTNPRTGSDNNGSDNSTTTTSSPSSSSTNTTMPNGAKKSAAAEDTAPSGGEKRSGNGSPNRRNAEGGAGDPKKRRSSSVGSRASALLASAKSSLHFSPSPQTGTFRSLRDHESTQETPLQKLGKQDPALSVPQGQHNNSAGESLPGPRSTFRVGVWEDKNKKCRRTMEDTHSFLYNFLTTPAPSLGAEGGASASAAASQKSQRSNEDGAGNGDGPEPTASLARTTTATTMADVIQTDNGYFAIFDGHAGTFAADWCGKKLHIILEEAIRRNPNTPIPELLDQTFTSVDAQLEKLPLKNSGCTAVTAVLRWEDRIPNAQSATGSTAIAPAAAAAVLRVAQESASKAGGGHGGSSGEDSKQPGDSGVDVGKTTATSSATPPAAGAGAEHGGYSSEATHAKLRTAASRQRVLYTANVGDARIVLCRGGKALRLSYDHKGSDEAEGKRVSNAGGLILNNRVNGVLAVTRALGDTYMKDLVTGHPYTTETVIQAELDEFIILACDGLWDVCQDQEAVDLIRHIEDPVTASKLLVDHALARFSTDNLSCMVVRLDRSGLLDATRSKEDNIGVEGDPRSGAAGAGDLVSEVDKIVGDAKRKARKDGVPGVGVSGSNSGKGHDPVLPSVASASASAGAGAGADEETVRRTSMERVVEEEPGLVEGDTPEVTLDGTKAIPAEQRKNLTKGIPEGS